MTLVFWPVANLAIMPLILRSNRLVHQLNWVQAVRIGDVVFCDSEHGQGMLPRCRCQHPLG